MSRLPDLLGHELEEGVRCLKDAGFPVRLVENRPPKGEFPPELPKRIVRQKLLPTGDVEIVYSVDTYQLKKESDL